MGRKYLILSLSTEYGKMISEKVANKLGLYFLSIDEYVEYSLFDSVNMMKVCGKDYYLEKENCAIKSCLSFENMLFSCSYDIFSNNEQEIKKRVAIVYLGLKKEELNNFDDSDKIVNQISFCDRDKYLRKHIEIIIESNLKNEDDCVEKIVNIIRTKYEDNTKNI